jgi:hypothetical protein
MKLTNLGIGLMAMGLVAAGCGSDDSTCGDAACPDSAVGSPDGGAGAVGSIVSGKYKATAATVADDGCKIDPMLLVTMNTNMETWIPVDVSGGTMKVGNNKGEPPAPSLGSGPYVTTGGTFKLTRMNHYKVPAPSTCEYDQDVTSTITLDAINSFGIGVVEKQNNRKNCTEPAGVAESCASSWSWRMVKAD